MNRSIENCQTLANLNNLNNFDIFLFSERNGFNLNQCAAVKYLTDPELLKLLKQWLVVFLMRYLKEKRQA